MNGSILRALFQDSLQQVLDNRVFRLLVILTIMMVVPSFAIGWHPDRVSLLWIWEYNYSDLTSTLGVPISPDVRPDEMVIQSLQGVFIEFFAGVFGIIFCIAATAFFVPRMLEKGAADTLFTKPVSRTVLLLMRYFSGLLFVGILSTVLVGGMWAGFALVSGYTDTGFMWSAVTLVYLYALLHAFSVLVATVTRSSITSILLVMILFTFSGCVHTGWKFKEFANDQMAFVDLRNDMLQGESSGRRGRRDRDRLDFLDGIGVTLDVLHYVLPKTSDATTITSMLRQAVEGTGPRLRDKDSGIEFLYDPEGMELQGSSTPEFDTIVFWTPAESSGAASRQSVKLMRQDREPDAEDPGEKRARRISAAQAAREFRDQQESLGHDAEMDRVSFRVDRTRRRRDENNLIAITWTEGTELDPTHRSRLFFHWAEWVYWVDFSAPKSIMDDEGFEDWQDGFFRGLAMPDQRFGDIDEWYEERFGWHSPWRFNAFFSIFSSLGFLSVCLLSALFRLKRYDL